MNNKYVLTFVIGLTLLSLQGCGESAPALSDVNDTNIKKVHALYNLYMARHGMQGPKDKKELIKYITTDPVAKIFLDRSKIDVATVEDLFVSQRDGQPFVIKYGLRGEANFPIIFESVGVDDMRMVALVPPREVDAESYEGLMEGSIAPEGPQSFTVEESVSAE